MEFVAWDFARSFARRKNDVRVLTTQCERLPKHCFREDVEIECIVAPSGRYSRHWWLRSRAVYLERLRQEADIVLSISAAAQSMAKDRKSGPPYFVAQAHGTAWGEAISKLRGVDPLNWLRAMANLKAMVDDRAYRSFDSFVAVGESVQNDLSSYPTKYFSGSVPIELIPNGIDTETFTFNEGERRKIREELSLSPTDKVVISTSRLHVQKGLAESLAAFELAAAKNASLRYVIVGTGPMERSLKGAVRSRGLDGLVKFAGFVPRDQMPAYLSAADIFLFTTFRLEGLPLNLLEALATGLRCIISNHVSDPSWGAIGVQPNDTNAVANVLLKLSDAGLDDRRSRLPPQYSLDVATDRYIELFERLIRGGAQ
jgi:glycosyltransferase involved in cell wall biosynthesis